MNRRTLLAMFGFTSAGIIGATTAALSFMIMDDDPEPRPVDAQDGSTDQPQPAENQVNADPSTSAPNPTPTPTPTPAPKPTHLDGLSGEYLPPDSTDGYHDLSFTQEAHGMRTKFSIKIAKASYKYYKGLPRVSDYGTYISHDADDESTKMVADTFQQYGDRHDMSSSEVADHVLAWVQEMKYTQDKAATGYNEYPKYPTETLVDKGGDCEDTSILLAAVLQQLGFGTILLLLPDAQHMAVGISGDVEVEGTYYKYNGKRYYYVETTGDGWRVGEMPPEVKEETTGAKILELNNSPAFGVDWNSKVPSDGGLRVNGRVHNLGDAPAKNITVRVRVKGPNGVVDQALDRIDMCPADNAVNFQTKLSPPAKLKERIKVEVISNRQLQVSSKSDFVSP